MLVAIRPLPKNVDETVFKRTFPLFRTKSSALVREGYTKELRTNKAYSG